MVSAFVDSIAFRASAVRRSVGLGRMVVVVVDVLLLMVKIFVVCVEIEIGVLW